MVLISLVISLPLSYLLLTYWLENFALKIDLQPWYFIGAGFIALVIAWLTVGTQAIKASRANPVQSLRSE
jgi:ABC-type antimicrobial peptide transport system permease subunit